MTETKMGPGDRIVTPPLWPPHDALATPRPFAGGFDRRRLSEPPPPHGLDPWHAVPEWATWLALTLGLSLVAVLLVAIVYLLG